MKQKIYSTLLLSFFGMTAVNSFGHSKDGESVHKLNTASKISFFENKGQWHKDAKYRVSAGTATMFLTDYGLVYNFLNQADYDKMHHMVDEGKNVDDLPFEAYAYNVKFKNANKQIQYGAAYPTKEYYNYIIGNDASKWASNVYGYGEVVQSNIYPNIDLKFYSNDTKGFKYDFVVKPNGNPDNIVMEFEGIKPQLLENGDIKLDIGFTSIVESAPITYQVVEGKQVAVASKYKVVGNTVTFEFPNGYNKALELIIDPSVIFATYSGSTGSNAHYAHTTTYDLDGNTYTCALSSGTNWPTTTGSYMTVGGGVNLVGLHKYSADGSQLIYGTFFGGTSSGTQPFTARVNEDFEVVLAGAVTTPSLPMLPTSYDNTLGGTQDIYLAKLSADGTTLLGSTYFGGSASEAILGTATTGTYSSLQGANLNPIDIAFDNLGNIWVASNTASTDFPTTPGAIQTTFGGATDAIVAKFNPTLANLLFSTYYGGTSAEGSTTIEFSNDWDVVAVGGLTASSNFPVTAGVIGGTYAGGTTDGFILTINPLTNARIAASFFGTTGNDDVAKLDFDCGGNIYMCGRNSNGTYPVNAAYSNPNGKIFIHKVSSDLTVNHLSTVVGASTTQQLPMGFMVDICGNIYVNTVSSSGIAGLPTTQDAVQTAPRSFWMIVLEPSLTDLYFATYFGSPSGDHAHPGVHRLDEQGFAYASVCGTSPTFPTTPGSWSPTKQNGGTNDNISFKFDFEARGAKVTGESPEGGNAAQTHAIRGCKSAFLHFKRPVADTVPTVIKLEVLGDAINGVDYQFIADSVVIPAYADSTSLEIKALLRSPATGVRRVIINTFSICSCNGLSMGEAAIMSSDTILIIDSVYVQMVTPLDTSCPGDMVSITATIDPTLKYRWTPANLIPDPNQLTIQPSPSVTTTFTIEAWQDGAPATCPSRKASYVAFVEPFPVINIPNNYLTVCLKDSMSLAMQVTPPNPRYAYEWGPAQYFSNPTAGDTKFFAPLGEYTIYMKATTPGAGCSSNDSMIIKVVPPLAIDSVIPKDTLIRLGDEINIAVVADESVMWKWSPNEFVEDPNMKVIRVKPDHDMRYTVTAWDQYGCFDEVTSNVRVYYEPKIFVPNAFSPNGDGLNDVFGVSNIQYEKLIIFRVFNRWGETVFETMDPNKFWDGTNKSGKKLDADVYYYQIVVIGPMPGDEQVEYKGDVTLIR